MKPCEERLFDAVAELERLRIERDEAIGMICVLVQRNMIDGSAWVRDPGDDATVMEALRHIIDKWDGDEG